MLHAALHIRSIAIYLHGQLRRIRLQSGSSKGEGGSALVQNLSATRERAVSGIQIRVEGAVERDLLVKMYDEFEPLGVAFGLPPFSAAARRNWIAGALAHKVNSVALSPEGAAVGHCFLAVDPSGSAEIAIFVRQEHRRRGIGKALVCSVLERGTAAGVRRVWSITSPDNRAALRLQQSCGFRVSKSVPPAFELEIELPRS